MPMHSGNTCEHCGRCKGWTEQQKESTRGKLETGLAAVLEESPSEDRETLNYDLRLLEIVIESDLLPKILLW